MLLKRLVKVNSDSSSRSQQKRIRMLGLTQGLQVCKWYLLWGLKPINRTYFGLFGAPGKRIRMSGLRGSGIGPSSLLARPSYLMR